jgi:hypothetical protein
MRRIFFSVLVGGVSGNFRCDIITNALYHTVCIFEQGSELWYTSQKEHWLVWLAQYDGPGAYNRKNWRGRSAEFVYNHIGNPVMLLWLAEVAGVPKAKLLTAKRAALSARLHRASHCGVLRKIIPWQIIEHRLHG